MMDSDLSVERLSQDRIMAADRQGRRRRRRQRRGRLLAAGGLVVIAGGAAALGLALAGGPSTERVSTLNPATPPSTGRPAAGPGSSVSPEATSVPGAFPPCRSGQLRISVTPYGYGMGEAAARISYINTSTTGCALDGYPAITVSSGSGTASLSARPTTPGRYLENQNLGSYPPAPVAIDLPKGGRAVSYMGWDGGASLPANRLSQCITGPWTVSVTLPGDGGVMGSDGDLGMGVCSDLVAEPIQAAAYRPGV
jgi:hypothetical protein